MKKLHKRKKAEVNKPEVKMFTIDQVQNHLSDVTYKFVRGNEKSLKVMHDYLQTVPDALKGDSIELLLTLIPKDIQYLSSYLEDMKDNLEALKALAAAIKIRMILGVY